LDAGRRKALKKAFADAQSLAPDMNELWASWPSLLIGYGLGEHLGALPVKILCKAA
jgi:hypothetical protein